MNEQQTQTILEEVRRYADTVKSQTDRVVTSIQSLIDDSNRQATTEEIIFPSAEMLETR